MKSNIENIEKIKILILEKVKNNKLSCAAACSVAEKNSIKYSIIGDFADKNDIRLCKCRLGLFGWSPEKKIVSPAKDISPELKEEIMKACNDNNLSCKSAFNIAEKLKIAPLKVSNACEALNIKLRNCRLKAF
jgi:hypothetical protein